MTKRSFLVAIFIALMLSASIAGAHTRSESYSHWRAGATAITGDVTIPLREVMLLYQDADASIPPRELFHRHLRENTAVLAGGGACELAGSDALTAASGFVRAELRFDCGDAAPEALHFRAMFDVAPAHVNYARLYRDGVEVGEILLTDAADTWPLADYLAGASATTFPAFVRLGIDHIAGGVDHIAFLFGLILVAGSLKRTIVAVTGFTLGHSISLAAAVLGYVRAEGQLVEAFIGLTVALVAIEYYLHRNDRTRWIAVLFVALAVIAGMLAVAMDYLPGRALFAYAGFGLFSAAYLGASRTIVHQTDSTMLLLFVATLIFGLVHGFGFAGFLMDTGLLGGSLLAPLFGFNIGVEIGQLIIVAIVLALAALLKDRLPRLLPALVAAGLCGVGVFWFVDRTFS